MNTVCEALKTLLQNALGSTYTVEYGKTNLPEESNLPLVQIIPLRTIPANIGTGGLSRSTLLIEVLVIVDKRNYITTADSGTQSYQSALVDIMEERNTNGTPKSTTVYGAIYADMGINTTVSIANVEEISYDDYRANSFYAQALLRLECTLDAPNCL